MLKSPQSDGNWVLKNFDVACKGNPPAYKIICFARTIIRNNKIVILDEPTSSLDSETKEIIHENIKKYLKDSTTILITNQKDLLKLCKRIIVIENGEVVEEGKYSKLIKDENSLFYSLFVK